MLRSQDHGTTRFCYFDIVGIADFIKATIFRGSASGNYRGTGWPLIPILLSLSSGFAALLFLRISVAGFLWALACLAAGSLLGIVFGIPRSASQIHFTRPEDERPEFQANTNMEQISDWLTKILVGAGLVDLKELPGAINSAARYIGPSLAWGTGGDVSAMAPIAAALIIYFSVEGFICGYIFTRVYFVIVLQLTQDRLHRKQDPLSSQKDPQE
jgi:hypothetical protein